MALKFNFGNKRHNKNNESSSIEEDDNYRSKFIEIEGSIQDLANKYYDNDQSDEGDNISSITSLIDDISYGYVSKEDA